MKTDNELIAEFDGWTHKPTAKGKGKGLWYRLPQGQAAWSASSFRYDTSWDWLMPVVEKIRQAMVNNDFEEGDYEANDIRINHLTIWADIKTVYNEVVTFINWYNSQTKGE